MAVPIYIPNNKSRGFPFLHTFSRIYCLWTFGSQPFWLVKNFDIINLCSCKPLLCINLLGNSRKLIECYCLEVGSHSGTLAWKIPWTEGPGGLQSMESLGVQHDWATSLSLFTFMHGRRKWQPTPVFLPGESQGRGSLVGCRLWGRTESDMTEAT